MKLCASQKELLKAQWKLTVVAIYAMIQLVYVYVSMLSLTYLRVFSTLTNMTFIEAFQNEDSDCVYYTQLQSVSCAFQ